MFKVKGGKIKVFSKFIGMEYGTHTLYVDKETGNISTAAADGLDRVVTYSLNEATGAVTIQSHLEDLNLDFKAPTRARSWQNGRKISSGPVYQAHKDINVYLEGFAFDFDYNSVVCTGLGIKPFRWSGGRVCFDDMHSVGQHTGADYTALPSSMSCGKALTDTYESGLGIVADIASVYGARTSGLQIAQQKNAMEWYGNATSIVFSYRSFKTYMSFARGMTGIFTCSLGAIGGTNANIEPDGDMGAFMSSGFGLSMFGLKQ